VGIRCADHATPSIRKNLALTSPTSGGRSVSIVRLLTKAKEFVAFVWQHITANNIRGVWKRILPHFEEETIIEEITNIGSERGFDELENDDVRELLISHSEELLDDLLLLDQQGAFEEADNDAEEQGNVQMKEFTLKEYEDTRIFRAVEVVKQKCMDAESIIDRSTQIRRVVDNALSCLAAYA
jgi:Mg/Co/Ni transporter MgtE